MAKFKNLNPVAVVVTRGDGGRLYVGGQKVVETEDPKWIRRLELRKDFQNVEEVVEHKTGAGLKTHISGSKSSSKTTRDKPNKEVKSKSKAKPKKPKGLKKSKRAD